MSNKSPWSKVPIQTENEEELWELQRELRALQQNIDHIGEGYPSYRHPRKNIPEFREFEVGSEDEMVEMLADLLDGNL